MRQSLRRSVKTSYNFFNYFYEIKTFDCYYYSLKWIRCIYCWNKKLIENCDDFNWLEKRKLWKVFGKIDTRSRYTKIVISGLLLGSFTSWQLGNMVSPFIESSKNPKIIMKSYNRNLQKSHITHRELSVQRVSWIFFVKLRSNVINYMLEGRVEETNLPWLWSRNHDCK